MQNFKNNGKFGLKRLW